MKAFIIIAAFYGATFALKESDIASGFRAWLIRRGVFFYHMLECWFCTGFWTGLIVYMLGNPIQEWNVSWAILWGLAGASVSYIGNIIVDRLDIR